MDDINNRLNFIESREPGLSDLSESELDLDLEQIKPALMADTEFVSGIVDNIMHNSNLSEIIEQIDAVQTENQELRERLDAQQTTIREMNIILMKLVDQGLNQSLSPIHDITATISCDTDAVLADDECDGNDDNAIIILEVVDGSGSNMQTVD